MSRRKVAFITGATGQDGAYIAHQLINDGWEVHGAYRRGSTSKIWRLEFLGILGRIKLVEYQLEEAQNIIEVLQKIRPSEIYHMAGESFVVDSFKYPGFAIDINTHGTLNILEAMRLVAPEARVFFASSSEIFGQNVSRGGATETTVCAPLSPYAISKLAAQNFVQMYRERYGLFACSGILFNHESPLRGREFVCRKITIEISKLKVKGGAPMELGNLDSGRDWGEANDYVRGMRAMLAVDQPQDMVIASGRARTVREVLCLAAAAGGFEPVFEGSGLGEICIDKKSGLHLAVTSQKYFRVQDTPALIGDASRIKALTGWETAGNFEKVIEEMVAADLNRIKNGNLYS